ncbi:electron transport complex subunit RsxC [Shewanella violacea]|uniref:Ion-translocating oxidoreductase complex subunit C n=2 Tax=Shewanella violacea TaxID=60217 RepID=D4ZKV9_SHEVD|nr:electron transport complex subunit RsxC [Shewanella violacea]BAJ02308.1 electron transport complex protein rnfC [Shewanella violacea DSS12]
MLTLFEQIDKGTLWRSTGGIHPPERKTLSNRSPIKTLPLADEYVVPLPQIGESAVLIVKQGDYVAKGAVLTKGTHFGHLPAHAPTSGHVSRIEQRPGNHASGLEVMSCVIKADGLDTQDGNIHKALSADEVGQLTDKQLLTKIQQAGIAGLGGAAFPTHIKLSPASDIELVIINGIECEPYITSDDMIMREKSDEILNGIAIIHKLLTPKRLIIAIEDNKPQAIEEMQHALNRSSLPKDGVRITSIPTLYPSGGEKQLIQILTGQEVPSGSIPAQLGIVVQNVATAYAINEAVLRNYPLIERVVTVTGENTQLPGNYWIPIGTPISHVLSQTQFIGNEHDKVIIGGPMMGYALHNDNAPTLKGSNCVLLPASDELAPEQKEIPCVRCGECAQVCPAQLLPQQLFWHAKAQEYDKATSFNLADCIECGCCTYVCPSEIPLVEYYRIAKSAIKAEAEEKKQAELAKQRFDLRTQRLEDEKRAREEKQKTSAARRKASMSTSDKDAVALAMAKIKAKKEAASAAAAQSQATDSSSTGTDADTKSQSKRTDISAAVARAKAKKAAQKAAATDKAIPTPGSIPESTAPADDRKAKIAAAVARAKAKKAGLKQGSADGIGSDESDTSTVKSPPIADEVDNSAISAPVDDKKARIAAAVARAKAKKAALKQKDDADTSTVKTPSIADEVDISTVNAPLIDDKKARIAATIAKAKAKKAAAQLSLDKADTSTVKAPSIADEVDTSTVNAPLIDDKKARIAATIAKAKAKKAAAQLSLDKADTSTVKAPSIADEVDISTVKSPAIDDKKARIAATIAKAKAKKIAAQLSLDKADTSTVKAPSIADEVDISTVKSPPLIDDKKARIAATIAKAKAKKIAAQQDADQVTAPIDDKKARIAAAVAKAKAKKAALNTGGTKTEDDKD